MRYPFFETEAVSSRFVSAGRMDCLIYENRDPSLRKSVGVVVIHSDSNYLNFSADIEFASRGYSVLAANPEGDGDLGQRLSAVSDCIRTLKQQTGVDKVVLFGHSGGATLMSAYQAIAENGTDIFKTPEMILPYPDDEILPPADGLIFPDANWGNAVMQLFSLDPAVTDNASGMKLDPEYNLFEPENGFSEYGSHFSDEFISRFLRKQGERNNEILNYALTRHEMIKAGKGLYSDDEPLVIPGANQGFFNNKLYAQDTRLMSHTAKPQKLLHADGSITREIVYSLRNPENPQSLTHSLLEGARIMTVYNYLTSYAVRTTDAYWYGEAGVKGIDWHSTYSSPVGNIEYIRVPTLIMGMTAGWEYLAGETIFEHSAAADKDLVFVEGANHKFYPEHSVEKVPGQFGDTMQTLHDYMSQWITRHL